jgi:hypothetical protein
VSTDTTTRPSFLGIEIKGDIKSNRSTPQRPKEELAPIVQAMLDDPRVVEFGWRQYTPYFNDGDPCHFRSYGAWVRLDSDSDDAEDYELSLEERDDLGERPVKWVGNERHVGAYEGPDEARHDRCDALYRAIDSDEFDDALLELFGDHAEVTVRRDGIQVDFYEHE